MNWQKAILILILVVFSNIETAFSQGTKFFEGSWKEALDLAKKENKLIFVDAYTHWCKPCRRMKNEILPMKSVGDFMNKNFINLSIDVNSWNGLVFSLYYNVHSYPSYFFIDSKGNAIHKESGFKNEKVFIKMGKFALKRHDNNAELLVKWEKDKQNYTSLLRYVKAQNKLKKSSEKIVLEFIQNNKLRGNTELRLIFDALNTSTGKLFKILVRNENWKRLIKLKKKDKIYNRLYPIFKRDIKSAAINNDKSQLKTIFKYIEKTKILPLEELITYKEMCNAERKRSYKKYNKSVIKYFNQTSSSSVKHEIIKTLYLKKINGKSLQNTALELAELNYKNANSEKDLILLIKILVLTKNYGKAKELIISTQDILSDNNYSKLRRYRKFLRKQ